MPIRSGVREIARVNQEDERGQYGLFAQTWKAMREEPTGVLKYFFLTVYMVARFLCTVNIPDLRFRDRLRVLAKIIQVTLKVPGCVFPIDYLCLVEGVYSAPREGVILEVGTFKGQSTSLLSQIAAMRGQRMIAIDTFAGLPESDETHYVSPDGPRRQYIFKEGALSSSVEEFHSNIKRYGVPRVVEVITADIRNLTEIPIGGDRSISFCFFDVDLLSSYKGCLRAVATQLAREAVIFLHEGALSPIRELLRDSNFWESLGIAAPRVTFLRERFRCRTNLAVLSFEPTPKAN